MFLSFRMILRSAGSRALVVQRTYNHVDTIDACLHGQLGIGHITPHMCQDLSFEAKIDNGFAVPRQKTYVNTMWY